MSQLPSTPKPLMSRKSGALQGTISVPGDKSISHRALILGAIAEGHTEITGLLEAEDILCTVRALQSLGANVRRIGGSWTVIGAGLGGLIQPELALDFGNSGTGARLMMAVVAGHPIRAVFTGDASLRRRPMGRVLDPLQRMGLDVEEGGQNTLPLTLTGTSNLVPISYDLPIPSAQVKSAVLIAGLLAPGTTSVVESEATRDHTEKMIAYFDGDIASSPGEKGALKISVQGQQRLRGKPVAVPGDPSSAAFPTAAALLCKGSIVTVRNVLVNPTRVGFYQTLLEMGADLGFENERQQNGETIADLRVKASELHGVHVPAHRAPAMIDEYPILAAVAAFAEGETVMEGLAELRVKESDRLAAITAGLQRCGVEAAARGDTLIVRGASSVKGGTTVSTHLDHRIAMAFLTLGLATTEPIIVDDSSMIATSFPEFVSLMQNLGATFEEVVAKKAVRPKARAASQ
jgi:3-phosphoshikimate 1-carboxyvinyltransferase